MADSSGQSDSGNSSKFGRALTRVVVPLLGGRIRAAAFATAGSLQVAAALAHVPGMPCPFLHLLHIPCPGCGISRACAATLQADFRSAFRFHAFAPFFLLAIVLCWMAALLPEKQRLRLVELIAAIERRTAVPALLLIAALFYWGARFLYAREQIALLSSR
jgi:hypothetical protein